MTIYSVNDEAFRPYGRVVTGLELGELMTALAATPQPEQGTAYVPLDEKLQDLPSAVDISEHLYGGMPVQLG